MQNSEWVKPALLGDVEQSREDPDATITLASLMGGEQLKRGEMLMDTGRATMPWRNRG